MVLPLAPMARADDAEKKLLATTAAQFDSLRIETLPNGLKVYLLPVKGAPVVSTMLATRVSPRILIPAGMLISAAGMWILTGLSLTTSYVSHTLPSAMRREVGRGLRGHVSGWRGAAGIGLALSLTGWGYLVGRLSRRRLPGSGVGS